MGYPWGDLPTVVYVLYTYSNSIDVSLKNKHNTCCPMKGFQHRHNIFFSSFSIPDTN